MQISHRLFFILYLVAVSFFLISGIQGSMLLDWDENIYAEASKQMLIRQDYLNIYINDAPFAEKPPFFFWMQAVSYHLFGVNEFSARLPSAFVGILMAFVLIYFGKKLVSFKLGVFWSLIFTTSLLTSILAKSAVIDHTFNFFITIGAFSLYFYDQSWKFQKWKWLFVASVAMGLAVLTKGPLGGVIPLVAFLSYKVFDRSSKILLSHFLFCAGISLSIATCWYWINWFVYGSEFLQRFIEFQIKLFSQSLEGHQGPFYYHILVAILGFAPWSFFLLGFQKKMICKGFSMRGMMILCLGWVAFVLLLFSFVQTKLPHYSASIYIPLSFIAALILYQYDEKLMTIKKRRMMLGLAFFALIFTAFPFVFLQYAQDYQIQLATKIENIQTHLIYVLSIVVFCLFITAIILLKHEELKKMCVVIFCAIFLFTFNVWHFLLPVYATLTQKNMIDLVKEGHQKGKLVFYRYVSFAALFYGEKPIEMLHTYKFEGNPNVLNQKRDFDIFVLTSSEHATKLQQEHPLVKPYKKVGNWFMGIIDQK